MNNSRFYNMKSCNDDYVPCFYTNIHLDAIDAKMEELYSIEIMMEMNLSEPESDDRPSFDDDDDTYYYKFESLSRYPVNVFAITPMSDDEEIDDQDYYEYIERIINNYE
jgi:hypothetical protein